MEKDVGSLQAIMPRTLFSLENIQYIGKTSQELSQLSPKYQYQDLISSRWDADEKAWNSGEMIRSEEEFPLLDGRLVVLDTITIPLFNSDGSRKALVVIGRDITERKTAEKENYQLAYYDQLTKLPNRFMFEKELKNQLVIANALQQKFVLIFLDIDRFKYINNSLGPTVGDQLLIQISDRLKQYVENDWFLAHLGGDEFAIIIPNINGMEDSIRASQNIIDSFIEPFDVNEYELFMTTSIGLCGFPQDGEDAESLMKNADIALKLAKEKGKNCYQVFNSEMDIATFKIFSLENSLNKAMTRNEFEVYYQPKIEVGTNRIIGAEALIRWNHPEWDLVSPREFISLAEETGLIVPMGEWIMQTVCKQLKEWQDAGMKIVPVSVNISAKRFMQKDFVSKVKRILQENSIDPSFFEIEITETSLIENEEIAIEVINDLRNFGIKVSLDDFGTGYSALSYLKHFKVDSIKIDRSFVQEIGVNKQDELVVKGIIQLIQSLNINVIAEGVETEEQLYFLRKHKCNQVQGYLYSRPVKAEEFEKMLNKGQLDVNVQRRELNHEFVNQRKYYRINLTHPLLADMTIIKFMGRDITLGKTEVLVEDIGLGGLRFASNIRMAARPDMVISVETEILGQSMEFIGRIVWLKECEDDFYHYGVEFMIDEDERDSIAKVLNSFSVRLRKNPILPDCRFIVTDTKSFFKQNK
ncbi:EAL domain-containing protein [Paenibacillus humicus]|uniref:EAL domain-containing protein n=1 Tax=Paenibacillus humicus TaxID=412861 RepID=UPI003D26BF21